MAKFIATIQLGGEHILTSKTIEAPNNDEALKHFAISLANQYPELALLSILGYPSFVFRMKELPSTDNTTSLTA